MTESFIGSFKFCKWACGANLLIAPPKPSHGPFPKVLVCTNIKFIFVKMQIYDYFYCFFIEHALCQKTQILK